MHFEALAVDYDGTLAHHGIVEPATLAALERLKASNRRLLMVTGREIEDLSTVFSRLDLFDLIVGENGALLYEPPTKTFTSLHEPPPAAFAHELQLRGVSPLSVGHVIVATYEPNEAVVLDVIKTLGLELEIIFNKGSVMVLPSGVNKATGLKAALKRFTLSPGRTVGIGDAENDHAFLSFCGFGVAVSNALPSLKEHADYITTHANGQGVTELIDKLIQDDLAGMRLALWRSALAQ